MNVDEPLGNGTGPCSLIYELRYICAHMALWGESHNSPSSVSPFVWLVPSACPLLVDWRKGFLVLFIALVMLELH